MKKVILIIVLVVLVITTGIMSAFSYKNNKEKEELVDELGRKTVHQTSVVYININSLIKVEYEEIFKLCSDDSSSDICSDISTKVISVEPFNSSAKRLYNNVYLLNKDIYEAINKIIKVANDNDIDTSIIEIVSNSGNFLVEKLNLSDDMFINYKFNSVIDEQELLNNSNNRVVVSFDTQGGSNIISKLLIKGSNIAEPEPPIKNGFDFVEWQLDGETYDFTTPVYEDIILVAIWKETEINSVW